MGIPLGDARSPEGAALRADWVDWLKAQGRWDWFCTFTFTKDVSAAQAERRFKQWVARLQQSLNHHSKSRKHVRVTFVLAIEYTTLKRVHLHAILKANALQKANRTRWAGRWDSIGFECGIAQVLPARPEACAYVVKYITKDGRLTIGGPFTTWHHPPESRKGTLPPSSSDGTRVNPLGGTQRSAGESKSSYQTATPSEPDGSPG